MSCMRDKPKVTVSARVDQDLADYLEHLASQHGMTRSEAIEMLLERGMKFQQEDEERDEMSERVAKLLRNPVVVNFLQKVAEGKV